MECPFHRLPLYHYINVNIPSGYPRSLDSFLDNIPQSSLRRPQPLVLLRFLLSLYESIETVGPNQL